VLQKCCLKYGHSDPSQQEFWSGSLAELPFSGPFIDHSVVLRQVHSRFQSKFSTERPSASSFELQYPLFFLRSSSGALLLFYFPPITFILPSIFPSKKVRSPVGVIDFLIAKIRPDRSRGQPSIVHNVHRVIPGAWR
jgi:hypothetical protein